MKCITVHMVADEYLWFDNLLTCMWSYDQNNEKFKLTLYHGYNYYNPMYKNIDYYSLVSNNIGYYSQMYNNIDYYRLICITIE